MDKNYTTNRDTNLANQPGTVPGLNSQNHLSHELEVFSFVSNKIDKLSTAVYMVTSYIEDCEPIKRDLRQVALTAVASAHNAVLHSTSSIKIAALQKDIKHVVGLLTLAQTMSMISPMNAEVLLSEYSKLKGLIASQAHTSKAPLSVDQHIQDVRDQHFFGLLPVASSNQTPVNNTNELYKPATPPASISEKKLLTNQNNVALPSAVSDTPVDRKTVATASNKGLINQGQKLSQVARPKRVPTFNEAKERKQGRQTAILDILDTVQELSIKDISKKVRGCSEKTIQRELNTLLALRKARRLGDKRWSKYIKI